MYVSKTLSTVCAYVSMSLSIVYARVCVCVCERECVHMCAHVCVYVCVCMYVQTLTHIQFLRAHTVDKLLHKYIHMRSNSHTHTHTHTCTNNRPDSAKLAGHSHQTSLGIFVTGT